MRGSGADRTAVNLANGQEGTKEGTAGKGGEKERKNERKKGGTKERRNEGKTIQKAKKE